MVQLQVDLRLRRKARHIYLLKRDHPVRRDEEMNIILVNVSIVCAIGCNTASQLVELHGNGRQPRVALVESPDQDQHNLINSRFEHLEFSALHVSLPGIFLTQAEIHIDRRIWKLSSGAERVYFAIDTRCIHGVHLRLLFASCLPLSTIISTTTSLPGA